VGVFKVAVTSQIGCIGNVSRATGCGSVAVGVPIKSTFSIFKEHYFANLRK